MQIWSNRSIQWQTWSLVDLLAFHWFNQKDHVTIGFPKNTNQGGPRSMEALCSRLVPISDYTTEATIFAAMGKLQK